VSISIPLLNPAIDYSIQAADKPGAGRRAAARRNVLDPAPAHRRDA